MDRLRRTRRLTDITTDSRIPRFLCYRKALWSQHQLEISPNSMTEICRAYYTPTPSDNEVHGIILVPLCSSVRLSVDQNCIYLHLYNTDRIHFILLTNFRMCVAYQEYKTCIFAEFLRGIWELILMHWTFSSLFFYMEIAPWEKTCHV